MQFENSIVLCLLLSQVVINHNSPVHLEQLILEIYTFPYTTTWTYYSQSQQNVDKYVVRK